MLRGGLSLGSVRKLRRLPYKSTFLRFQSQDQCRQGQEKTYFVTTPIFYVNGDPHLGHAYTAVIADVIARFQRLDGRNVFLLTGTDEHGQKVERSARLKGMTTLDFVNEKSLNFQSLMTKLHCRNSDFIRTTEDRHRRKVEELWNELMRRDMIYLGYYEGWYSVVDETFYSDRELVDGKAPTGSDVEWIKEESYFFRLSKWTKKLKEHFASNPDFIVPASRQKEMIHLLEANEDLDDISVSRTSFSWGINVPSNSQHVVYVWLDALVNYISAVDVAMKEEETLAYRKFWPPDVHIVGKDILYFHSILWPALLMAAGLGLPKQIVAHGWWLNNGKKMSKSLGNVVDPFELLEKYGACSFRYFLLAETSASKDGDFSESALIRRVNADLADTLGNLVLRVFTLVHKKCGGIVPAPFYPSSETGGGSMEKDDAILSLAEVSLCQSRILLNAEKDLHKIINIIIKLPREGNRYIDSEAPWNLVKTNPTRANTVLYVLLEIIRQTAILLQPFVPQSSGFILDQLCVTDNMRSFSSLSSRLSPGTILPAHLEPIFPRF